MHSHVSREANMTKDLGSGEWPDHNVNSRDLLDFQSHSFVRGTQKMHYTASLDATMSYYEARKCEIPIPQALQ